jgi:hypothetical protein
VQKSAACIWSAVVAELAMPCRCRTAQEAEVRENKCILLFKKWQRLRKNFEQFISEYNNKNTFSGI